MITAVTDVTLYQHFKQRPFVRKESCSENIILGANVQSFNATNNSSTVKIHYHVATDNSKIKKSACGGLRLQLSDAYVIALLHMVGLSTTVWKRNGKGIDYEFNAYGLWLAQYMSINQL